MIRHRVITAGVLSVAVFIARSARTDAYDPPAGYYSSATGTGGTLQSQLNDIIDDHAVLPYNDNTAPYLDTRTALQVTDDATPENPNDDIIRLVYNGVLLNVSGLNGPPPGWDFGALWDREHTWPRSRGIDESGADNTDLHHLMPSTPSVNSNRGNRNFGGAFGQPFGVVTDSAPGMWYAGDADAGRIARAQFYMAVRYDGSDASTTNLELAVNSPAEEGTLQGDRNRLVEWHFAAPPVDYERRRNDVVYEQFQSNRNPFIDRPEFAWSVFVDQANDSRITIDGTTPDANGGSMRNVDLGRVFTGSAVPSAQAFTLNKAGTDGTYFEVTTSGTTTSSINGRYNAFRTNQNDSKPIIVGLNTSTATAGLRSGAVTVNNLDITTAGGAGRGANDADDVFNVSLTVLDHATPSFSNAFTVATLPLDFGTVTTAASSLFFTFDVFNRGTTPAFTANMDFDSVLSAGDTSALTTNADAFAGTLVLAGGASQTFTAMLSTAASGSFAATYTLRFSDENIPGAQSNKDIVLSLIGTVVIAGDFNRDSEVDAADYVVWRKTDGTTTAAFSGADADGSGFVDAADLTWWEVNFGQVAGGSGGSQQVPEPATVLLAAIAAVVLSHRSRRAH